MKVILELRKTPQPMRRAHPKRKCKEEENPEKYLLNEDAYRRRDGLVSFTALTNVKGKEFCLLPQMCWQYSDVVMSLGLTLG